MEYTAGDGRTGYAGEPAPGTLAPPASSPAPEAQCGTDRPCFPTALSPDDPLV